MSALLHWFTSPEWAQVVKALLHSLWQGAAISLVLVLVLRRLRNPVTRYRSSLAALTTIIFATVLTWAIINPPSRRPPLPAHNPPPIAQPLVPEFTSAPGPTSKPETAILIAPESTDARWIAWLAFAWLAGAILMLARAGFKVAAAEKLRRSCHPLKNPRIETLLTETRRALGIANRIRVGVTDKLTSPAVVGVVVPMLILPLALLTTLTPEQIRFVLLHELAHIRRRDYLANLFQFVAESLLFFNPAVWWISHQIRREREACCDALATELSGAPADYAQTLVQVAEQVLNPTPAAANAFNNKHEPSLAERIQRLLVPGYRPSLQFTWRAMLAALIIGGVLLFSSALGTRLTVAAVLTNSQNVASSNTNSPDAHPMPNISPRSNIVSNSPERQKIYEKLNDIRFDSVAFPNLELSEVVRTLIEQTKLRDPNKQGINFIISRIKPAAPPTAPPSAPAFDPVTGAPIAPAEDVDLSTVRISLDPGIQNVRLIDVLDAIVKSADHPIQYSVLDYGIEFYSHPFADPPELKTRTFKIDPNQLLANLGQQITVDVKPQYGQAIQSTIFEALTNAGFDLSPPRHIFFVPAEGRLIVRTTAEDLDDLEKLISEPKDPAGTSAPSNATPSESSRHEDQIQTAQLVQDGKLMFQLGKLDEAEAKLTEALNRDPHNQAALYYSNLVKQTRAKKEMNSHDFNNKNPAHNLSSPNPYARSNVIYTSPQRQGIYRKLNDITFDKIVFPGIPLSEVVRVLTEQTEARDPDKEGLNFVISKVKPNPAQGSGLPAFDPTTGQPIAPAPAEDVDLGSVQISLDPGLRNVRLMDVLEAIVKTADHPIKYSILDYGIEFSFKGPETPELFTRTFKLDPNAFYMSVTNAGFTQAHLVPRGLKFGSVDPTVDIQAAVIGFFDAAGVSLSPPKSVFFNDRQGTLTVRATADDLDLIEATIDTLKVAPQQVSIKTRFVQLTTGSDWREKMDWIMLALLTNRGPTFAANLTSSQFQNVLEKLAHDDGANLINEGQVTTLSGRQAQFQLAEVLGVDTSTGIASITNGTTLDVVPAVSDDRSTIQITLIPTVTEFLGTNQFAAQDTVGGVPITKTIPFPKIRVRQTTLSDTVKDGQTLVLGDISGGASTITSKNLLIFVTPTLVDSFGHRLHSADYYDSPVFQGPGSGGGGFGGGFRGGGQ